VGIAGCSPALPAISIWVYLIGSFESNPCLAAVAVAVAVAAAVAAAAAVAGYETPRKTSAFI